MGTNDVARKRVRAILIIYWQIHTFDEVTVCEVGNFPFLTCDSCGAWKATTSSFVSTVGSFL